MKSQMDLIYHQKKKQSNSLKKARNKYIATVYDDLIKRKNLKQIHADIQKIIVSDNNEGLNSSMMGEYAYNVARRVKRKIDTYPMGYEAILLAEIIFKRFQKEKVFTETNTLAYDTSQKREEERKTQVIEDIEKQAFDEKKVFYLCSEHKDCALDHIDYQGKIYVDDRWQSIIQDDVLKGMIANYVIMNNIQTFQWVIGRPVWMTTRPNCRHFFKLLNNSDVLKAKNTKKLLKKNKMYFAVGRGETQSINHSTKKSWYTKENVENIIRLYRERLEFHKSLYEVQKVPLIKRAIEKDRLLINKWTTYLQKI